MKRYDKTNWREAFEHMDKTVWLGDEANGSDASERVLLGLISPCCVDCPFRSHAWRYQYMWLSDPRPQEEPAFYDGKTAKEARHLIEREVEFSNNGRFWKRGKLTVICWGKFGGSSAFGESIESVLYPYIRAIKED